MEPRWPAAAKRIARGARDDRRMHTRVVDGVTIRPLRNGDVATVSALHAGLGAESRRRRFGGAKPRLAPRELAELARVDGSRHALVAYLDGDPQPAGIAHLVRDGATAEVACAVADECQSRGVGRVLLGELAALARAAGVEELHATVCGDNPRVVALASRLARITASCWDGGELELVLAL
jgi:GNAT superfamily N-acetyltransferase